MPKWNGNNIRSLGNQCSESYGAYVHFKLKYGYIYGNEIFALFIKSNMNGHTFLTILVIDMKCNHISLSGTCSLNGY